MSRVMPYSDDEAREWAARGPEPVEVDLPGWEVTWTATGLPECSPNERWQEWERDGARVSLTRWWDLPLSPGGPMKIESNRPVTVAGRELELSTTSMFAGSPKQVDVLFLRGNRWSVRIVLDGCGPEQTEQVLAAIRILAD